jgi:hypothetical protein
VRAVKKFHNFVAALGLGAGPAISQKSGKFTAGFEDIRLISGKGLKGLLTSFDPFDIFCQGHYRNRG